MRQRAFLIAILVGVLGIVFVPAASAQGLGVADTCTTPTTGTTLAPNQPCWIPGLYSGDYTGTSDTNYYTQAGGHPYVGVTDFTVANTNGVPAGNVTGIRTDVPPGLISNPQAVPKCTAAQFPKCPSSTQLGVVQLEVYSGGADIWFGASVYNMVPPAGKVSDFAFNLPLVNVRNDIIGGVRGLADQFTGVPNLTADDGLYFTIAVPSSPVPAELVRSTLIFWGIPGDAAHAPDLGWSCTSLTSALTNPTCTPPPSAATHTTSGTPFLTLPTGCLPAGQPSTLTLTDSSGALAQTVAKTPVPETGCHSLPFTPTLRMALTGNHQTTDGKHPTLTATVGQGPGQTNVRSTKVTLPLSLALDPNNAQVVCSVANAASDSCPANTAIGSAVVNTPVLDQPLRGTVYLVQGIRTGPQGQQIRTLPALLITLRGEVAIDLRGQTTVDSQSRLVTTFPNVPDAPVSTFTLTINGGRRGVLVVTGGANLCRGRQVGHAVFGGQNGATRNLSVPIGTPCPTPPVVKRLTASGPLVRLAVSVPAAGTLRAGGAGFVAQVVHVPKPKTVSLTLHLTRGAAARLKRVGRLRLSLAIRYTPKGSSTQAIVARPVTIRRRR